MMTFIADIQRARYGSLWPSRVAWGSRLNCPMSVRLRSSGVFLTKRYDVPYNCKIGAHSAPLVAFEPLARNPLVSLFADMSFQGTSVNVGYNSRSARHLM